MIQAVLFDMDGLLTDSERVAMEINVELYERLHYGSLNMDVSVKTLGVTRQEVTEMYASLCPAFNADKFYPLYDRAFLEAAEQGRIPAKKGAKRLLEYLRQEGIPFALCTSTARQKAERTLRSAGLDSFFSVFATGDMVRHGKPEPDLFLMGAELLHVRPEDCLVLEDSVNGIRAGRKGGMTVYMVPDILPYRDEYAPFCDAVCSDLDEVTDRLRAMSVQ